MNKMKKLLSVILAVIMILSSMTVMASAAVTKYQTPDELTALDAYSPYGTVTRLSTEERMSIVYDFLDVTLPKLNINMGTVINMLGITVTINLTSVDNICLSIDSFKNSKNAVAWSIVAGIFDLGILETLDFSTWNTGIDRATDSSLTLVSELVELLANNTAAVDEVLSKGIELGMVKSFIKGLDLSSINKLVKDIPALIKGMIYPMFERWDHTLDEVNALEDAMTGDGNVVGILDYIVNDYFDKPQSMTTVKADANGNIISDHTLPTSNTRRTYIQSADKKSITINHYQTQSDVDANELDDITAVGYMELDTYVLAPEYPDNPDSHYVFQYTDEYGNVINLKYYENGSYFLPSYVEAGESFNIASETGANLLYEMIPYVFDEMVPVVANGSLKKILAGFFGTQFTAVGNVVDGVYVADEDAASRGKEVPAADLSNTFFTEPQGDYLWEWSNYAVINGTHYYRFEDQIFMGDTSKANEYMNIINWDYEITSDLLAKYIPADTSSKSAAGYSKILHGVNDFLIDLATEVADLTELDVKFTKGDNSNLVDNLQIAAKAVLTYHPEHIFGSAYEDEDHYYNLIVGDDPDMVLTGVAALAVDGLAKQMTLPGAKSLEEQGVKVGGILAAMLRELATQILPHYDYDALIYSDYNTRTFVSGEDKDNSYWLDVIMTMAVDIGMKYLHNLADMNEDTQAWKNLGYTDSMTAEKIYSADSFDQTGWEDKVDYVIDWALTSTTDGSILTWGMTNLVGKYVTDAGCTISLSTNEDPWAKLDAILDNVLFLDQFTSETDLKKGLRGTIEDLVNLNWENILGTETNPAIIDVPATSRLVTTDLLSALSLEVRDLINGLFKNVGGGSYYFIPESITNLDQLANQNNLKTIIKNLLAALPTAYANGLVTTALPFVNMFLGWSTDAQKYATPSIYFTNEYVYADSTATSATATINVINNSSGMLLKHRANIKSDDTYVSTVDQPYTLKITNVESSVPGATYSTDFANGEEIAVAPYGTAQISATIPYSGSDVVARFVVTYSFMGKDGKEVGGEMKVVSYQLFTSTKYDNPSGLRDGDDDTGYTGISDYYVTQFTKDVYSSITTQTVTVSYISAITGDKDRIRFGHAVTESGGDPTGLGAQYFRHINSTSGANEEVLAAGWSEYFGGSDYPDNPSTTGRIYLPLDGVTKDTEFPYGLYDMGILGIKFYPQDKDCNSNNYSDGSGDTKVIEYDYYYYTDHDIDVDADEYVGKALLAENFTDEAQDEFTTYEEALMNVVKLAKYPMTLEYNETIEPQILDAVQALKDAYEALMNASDNADASAVKATDISGLEEELAKDDGDGEVEINFQDYDLFEYFEYQDYRTSNRNLVKTFYAPAVLEKYYINGSGITYDELKNDVIPNAESETYKAAITATLSERTDEEVEASQNAHDEFNPPYVDELYIGDQTSRLAYYRQFLLPISADLTFLTREIAYADANYPASDEALYTAASWEAYRDAYDYAKSMTDANIPSDVFEAKYNLMVAMKNLLLKSESAIENGATADLLANMEIAESILAMNLDEIVLSDVAIEKGLTKEEALGHLLFGLGYKYTGRDGEEYDLYANSAIEYTENDRPNVSTNIARIDACNENLEACIAYFEFGMDPSTLVVRDEYAESGLIVDLEIAGMMASEDWYAHLIDAEDANVTGVIYGLDTIGYDDLFESESYPMLEDALTTNNGDEYLEIITPEASEGYETTGTIINVLGEDGEVLETYVFVYFGDVNGDGYVDAVDGSEVFTFDFTQDSITTLAATIAADYNGDSYMDANDGSDLFTVDFYQDGYPLQADLAEAFYAAAYGL